MYIVLFKLTPHNMFHIVGHQFPPSRMVTLKRIKKHSNNNNNCVLLCYKMMPVTI